MKTLNSKNLNFKISLSTLFASAFISACATSPTGRSQLTLFPDSQMTELGAKSFDEIKAKVPKETDPKVIQYVKCVSEAITRESAGRTESDNWEVVVFKDKSANAFALPGGKIGVHTGLLAVAKNQHQLAAVIGHEVGHVIARHGNERVSAAMATQGALTAIQMVGGKNLQEKGWVLGLLGVGAQFGVLMPHGRSQESESDTIGIELMAQAGFDPRESVKLWENMGAAGGSGPPEFLSTHPSHSTRIQGLNDRMGDALAKYEAAKSSGRNPKCGP